MKKLLLPVLAVLLLKSALGQQVRIVTSPDAKPKHHAGRVIVRFRGGPQPINGSGQAKGLIQQLNLFSIDNPSGMSVEEAVGRYKNNPNVLYVEPDYEVQAVDATPSDTMWAQQWDMMKIQAPKAWDVPYSQTNSSDVVVAIIDTGIAYNHPDLQGNLWTDPSTGA